MLREIASLVFSNVVSCGIRGWNKIEAIRRFDWRVHVSRSGMKREIDRFYYECKVEWRPNSRVTAIALSEKYLSNAFFAVIISSTRHELKIAQTIESERFIYRRNRDELPHPFVAQLVTYVVRDTNTNHAKLRSSEDTAITPAGQLCVPIWKVMNRIHPPSCTSVYPAIKERLADSMTRHMWSESRSISILRAALDLNSLLWHIFHPRCTHLSAKRDKYNPCATSEASSTYIFPRH